MSERVERVLGFRVPRVPPLRQLSPLLARAGSGALGSADVPWEELALRLAVGTIRLAADASPRRSRMPLNTEARVTQAVRTIDRHPRAALSLARLAREANLSPYHFLRTFQRVTGITPHQYVLRARLRDAATRLVGESAKIVPISRSTPASATSRISIGRSGRNSASAPAVSGGSAASRTRPSSSRLARGRRAPREKRYCLTSGTYGRNLSCATHCNG